MLKAFHIRLRITCVQYDRGPTAGTRVGKSLSRSWDDCSSSSHSNTMQKRSAA